MKLIKHFTLWFVCVLSFCLTAKAAYGHDQEKLENRHTYSDDKAKEREVPIDGGISLLIAAGTALGAKKIFNKVPRASQVLNDGI